MAQSKVNPEGQVVASPKWAGNNITNDLHIIRHKGIKSPKRNDMYAVARHRNRKKEVWFRTAEKLQNWAENEPQINEYKITLI